MTYIIAVGGIRYETNSFAAGLAQLADFESHFLRESDAVFDAEPNTEIRGAREEAVELGVVLRGLLDTFGGCGPRVEHRTYLDLKQRFLELLEWHRAELHAVYLPLHGAMTTDRCDDIEGDLVCAVRDTVGLEVPLVVSFDLHGAPSDRLLVACDALIGFKTCPHTDYEETGRKAIRLAVEALTSGKHLKTVRQRIPLLTQAEAHDTETGPMAFVQACARELTVPPILDLSVFMCQPWLDTRRSSWSVTAVHTSDTFEEAPGELLELAQSIWARRRTLRMPKMSVSEAIAYLESSASVREPYLIADSGDSPSAGSTGDSTDLLAALIPIRVPGTILAAVTDPHAARLINEMPLGSEIHVSLGGSITKGLTSPLSVTGTTCWRGRGRYVSGYPAGPVDIGAVGCLRTGSCIITVTERPAMMLDPALYRHVGVDPRNAFAVQVKSAGGFRALWAPISHRVLVVDTRGASDGELRRLPFQHIEHPMYPFDPDLKWSG